MPERRLGLTALVLVTGTLALPLFFWRRLPLEMPISWTWHGEIAAYASRPVGAFLMPLLTLLVWALIASLPRISPREFAHPPLALIHAAVKLAMVGFMSLAALLILLLAAGMPVASGRSALGVLGLFLAALGAFAPGMARRSIAGIRGNWPQSYSDIWLSAGSLAGKLLIPAGLLVALSAALSGSLMPAMILVPTALFLPMVFSFVSCWKLESARQQRESSRGPDAG